MKDRDKKTEQVEYNWFALKFAVDKVLNNGEISVEVVETLGSSFENAFDKVRKDRQKVKVAV